jgi:predicted nucleotidyltransferase
MSLDALFQELNDLYASGDGVLGTYVSGSAAYGGMHDYSDVDYYVLTKAHHGMSERILGAIKVEVRWRTQTEIELDIAQGGKTCFPADIV